MNTTGRPVFGVTLRSRCANCGKSYGSHCGYKEECPKVVNGKIVEEQYARTKFKAVRLRLQPYNSKMSFYPKSFTSK